MASLTSARCVMRREDLLYELHVRVWVMAGRWRRWWFELLIPSWAGTERELNLAQRSPRIRAHTSQKQMLCGERKRKEGGKKPYELFIVFRGYVSSSFTFLLYRIKWSVTNDLGPQNTLEGERCWPKKKEWKKTPKHMSSRDPRRKAKQLDPLFFSGLLAVRALCLWAAVRSLSLFLYFCCSWTPSTWRKKKRLGTTSHCFTFLQSPLMTWR